MTHRLRTLALLPLAFALLLGACAGSGPGTVLTPTTYHPVSGALPNFSHIFVIVMENREYNDIIGSKDAPYINQLADSYGLATQYYAVTHPSAPNYLSLLGGDYYGIQSDCTDCYVHATNLVDGLEAGHKTWRAYMEGMPSPCFVGDSYPYAQKHDPFMYFDDIRKDPQRCQNVVPFTQFNADLTANTVPNFTWISPDLCHDMHDCSTSQGDTWLKQWVPRILASSAWRNNGALFITWDEGTTNNGCCAYASGGNVPMLVISPLGKQRYQSTTPYDHYSLLRTVTDAWGLAEVGRSASPSTTPLVNFFAPH